MLSVQKQRGEASDMVITIARQYGSGGLEIGQRLAKKLGIPCYNVDLMPGGNGDEQFAVIRECASKGNCVIVGFCADYVLRERDDLICVFIHSGLAERAQRLHREYGINLTDAQREAIRTDRERARLYGIHTGTIWAELSHYDLTIDSGPLGISGTVALLSQFVALKIMRRRPGREDTL